MRPSLYTAAVASLFCLCMAAGISIVSRDISVSPAARSEGGVEGGMLDNISGLLYDQGVTKAEVVARNKPLIKARLVSAAPSIMFLPRAGLNSVFPLIIYTAVLALLLGRVAKFPAFATSRHPSLHLATSGK